MDIQDKKIFAQQLEDNLNNNILPYWLEKMPRYCAVGF